MVISAVANEQCEAGAAPRPQFTNLNQARNLSLIALQEVRSACVPWLATKTLDPSLADGIRKALLSLTNSEVLGQIPDLQRFESAKPSDYDELQQQIELAGRFDRRRQGERKAR